jgi:hypothetical protein
MSVSVLTKILDLALASAGDISLDAQFVSSSVCQKVGVEGIRRIFSPILPLTLDPEPPISRPCSSHRGARVYL